MATSLLQVRVEDSLKSEAATIYEDLGIDLSTAVRMFLKRSVMEQGIPFSMKLGDSSERRALAAMKEASKIAEENDISEMTLDEINAEIAEARK